MLQYGPSSLASGSTCRQLTKLQRPKILHMAKPVLLGLVLGLRLSCGLTLALGYGLRLSLGLALSLALGLRLLLGLAHRLAAISVVTILCHVHSLTYLWSTKGHT